MPLTSKNAKLLKVGDVVSLDWTVTRTFTARYNVVRVARTGGNGQNALSPTLTTMRVTTRPVNVITTPPGTPLTEGMTVSLLWVVSKLFPESGMVQISRDGLSGIPGSVLGPVSLSTGVPAVEATWVDPTTLPLRSVPPDLWTDALVIAPGEVVPDMLPFSFDPMELTSGAPLKAAPARVPVGC